MSPNTENLSPKRQFRPGLYLKIPSQQSEQMKKIQHLLEFFHNENGRNICVYVYFQDTKKLMLTPHTLWVDSCDALITEASYIIGAKNVAMQSGNEESK